MNNLFSNSSKRSKIIILLSVLFYVALFLIATPNINGTDQFWHYNYVDSILSGNFRSTEIYPAVALNPDWDGSMPGLFHNMPILYIWAFFAFIFGSNFHGAMVANMLFTVISALCVSDILKKHTNRLVADMGFIVMLFFPLIFFQSVQMLTELSAMTFLLVAIWLFMKKSVLFKCVGSVFLAAALQSRTNLILIVIALIYLLLFAGFKKLSKKDKLLIIVPFAVFVIFYLFFKQLFKAEVSNSFSKSILDSISIMLTQIQHDNMALMFYGQFKQLTFGEMIINAISKALLVLKIQLDFSPKSILFILNNLTFILALILNILCLRRTQEKKIHMINLILIIVIFCSWLGGAVIFQNQVRYQLVFIPFIIYITLYSAHTLNLFDKKSVRTFSCLIVAGCVGVSGILALKSNIDAKVDYNLYSSYIEEINKAIEDDANVVVFDNSILSKAAYPRITTRISGRYEFSESEKKQMLLGTHYSNSYVIIDSSQKIHENYDELMDTYFEEYFSGDCITVYKLKSSSIGQKSD